MQSCGGVDDAGALATHTPAAPDSSFCKRCSAAAVVAVRGEAFCGACLAEVVLTKYRAASSRAGIRYGSKLLIACSGGPCSRTVLEALKPANDDPLRRKMDYDMLVVFVDSSALEELHAPFRSLEERTAAFHDLCAEVRSLGYDLVHVRIEDLFSTAGHRMKMMKPCTVSSGGVETTTFGSDWDPLEPIPTHAEKLHRLFQAAKTRDAKQDLLDVFIQHSIVATARATQHTRVIVGTCATRSAEIAIERICKGRGGSVPLSCNVMDWRHGDVCFYAPLQELERKELSVFVRHTGGKTIWFPDFTTAAPQNSSIAALSNAFLAGLQESFPSTTFTIVRTVQKLIPPAPVASSEKRAMKRPAARSAAAQDKQAPDLDLEAMMTDAHAVAGKLCPICQDVLPTDVLAGVSSFCSDGPSLSFPLFFVVCRGCQRLLEDCALADVMIDYTAGVAAPAAATAAAAAAAVGSGGGGTSEGDHGGFGVPGESGVSLAYSAGGSDASATSGIFPPVVQQGAVLVRRMNLDELKDEIAEYMIDEHDGEGDVGDAAAASGATA